MQFNVLKLSRFSANTVFVCHGSGFEPYQDSYNKTRLAHEKHHIQAQKETKNVSHMSPKSGQSVLKTKETKGT